MEKEDNRQSLTIRLQPRENSPFFKIATWLNSMSNDEKNKKVGEGCLMLYLPYALNALGDDTKKIELVYWDVHQQLQNHLFVMRQALGIETKNTSVKYDVSELNREADGGKSALDMDSVFGIS